MQNGPESEKGSDNFIGPETKKILNGPGAGSTDSRKRGYCVGTGG